MEENKKISFFDKIWKGFMWFVLLIPVLFITAFIILFILNTYNYYFSDKYVDQESLNYSFSEENDLWESESNRENRMRLESIAVSNLISSGMCSDDIKPMRYTVKTDFLSSVFGGIEDEIEYCENDQEFIVTLGGIAIHQYFFQGSPFKK